MQPIKGTFKTESGVELSMKGIPPNYFARWHVEYKKKYPEPVPPMIVESIVDTTHSRRNTDDPWYKKELELWQSRQEQAMQEWMWGAYISTNAPDDFEPDESIVGERELTDKLKRVLWIEAVMPITEQAEFAKQHLSLTIPIDDAIEDAEKN